MPTVVIALTGQTGAGKDTLADKLVSVGYKKLSFGSSLRDEVREQFGPCDDERDPEYCQYGSFKDAMNVVGKASSAIDPFRRVKCLTSELHKHISLRPDQPVVITDVRKPIELDCLLRTPDLLLYFVVIQPDQRRTYARKRLDCLLADKRLSQELYKSVGVSVHPNLPLPLASLSNDGTPAELFDKMLTVLEICLPIRTGDKRNDS